MPFASPYHEVEHLQDRTFRHVQYLTQAVYRDLHTLQPIQTTFAAGDENNPHLITAAPFWVSVADDGARRFHPTREPDRFFEIGRPKVYINSEWRDVGFSNCIRQGNKITWQRAQADMSLIMAGHYLKLEIELKNGYIPPDNLLAFPVDLVGLARDGGRILADGQPVMQLRRPFVYDAADPSIRSPIPHHFVRSAGQWYVLFTLPEIRHMARPVIDPVYESSPGAASGADTYIQLVTPNTNFGNDTNLATDANARHTLIEFKISPIPAGAICLDATIYLTSVASAATVDYDIYSVHSNADHWTELTATWNDYTTATAWPGSAGAKTAGTDYESSKLGTISYPDFAANTQASAALTAARVQDWFGLSNTNYGLLIGVTGSSALNNWYSSDAVTAAHRPKLVVTYTLTAPPLSAISLRSALTI